MKTLVAKRTETYVLIKLSEGQSAIINTKFLRKKESDDTIYFSVPEDYTIRVRRTKYNPSSKKYELVSESDVSPKDIYNELRFIKQSLNEGHQLDEILDYAFENRPF